jgi:hypothetical protein
MKIWHMNVAVGWYVSRSRLPFNLLIRIPIFLFTLPIQTSKTTDGRYHKFIMINTQTGSQSNTNRFFRKTKGGSTKINHQMETRRVVEGMNLGCKEIIDLSMDRSTMSEIQRVEKEGGIMRCALHLPRGEITERSRLRSSDRCHHHRSLKSSGGWVRVPLSRVT